MTDEHRKRYVHDAYFHNAVDCMMSMLRSMSIVELLEILSVALEYYNIETMKRYRAEADFRGHSESE